MLPPGPGMSTSAAAPLSRRAVTAACWAEAAARWRGVKHSALRRLMDDLSFSRMERMAGTLPCSAA